MELGWGSNVDEGRAVCVGAGGCLNWTRQKACIYKLAYFFFCGVLNWMSFRHRVTSCHRFVLFGRRVGRIVRFRGGMTPQGGPLGLAKSMGRDTEVPHGTGSETLDTLASGAVSTVMERFFRFSSFQVRSFHDPAELSGDPLEKQWLVAVCA